MKILPVVNYQNQSRAQNTQNNKKQDMNFGSIYTESEVVAKDLLQTRCRYIPDLLNEIIESLRMELSQGFNKPDMPDTTKLMTLAGEVLSTNKEIARDCIITASQINLMEKLSTNIRHSSEMSMQKLYDLIPEAENIFLTPKEESEIQGLVFDNQEPWAKILEKIDEKISKPVNLTEEEVVKIHYQAEESRALEQLEKEVNKNEANFFEQFE